MRASRYHQSDASCPTVVRSGAERIAEGTTKLLALLQKDILQIRYGL
jgi:hypothetical protein